MTIGRCLDESISCVWLCKFDFVFLEILTDSTPRNPVSTILTLGLLILTSF